MKVLWITFWGSWTKPLLRQIKNLCQLEVIIPSEGKSGYHSDLFEEVKLHYVTFPAGKGVYIKMNEEIFSRYREIIDSFHPDVIHVHGTEKNLAQVQNFVKDIPVVISIQGLLSGCLRYNSAFLTKADMIPFTSLKNCFGHGGLHEAERICKRGVYNYEEDILKNGRYFIGRTLWDKAHTKMINPNSKYFIGEELLRPVFYERLGQWNLNNCVRYSIMMPSGYNPLKGMHVAIKSIIYLKHFFPNVVLKIPGIPKKMLNRKGIRRLLIGEEYIEYCKSLVYKNNIEDNIQFLPYLSEEEMAAEMLKSHVFLSCSTIDNSSNAIGESTMLGVPLVSTAVGGVISILKDEENVLFVPSGDSLMMAYQIKRIFDSDILAMKLSKAEIGLACIRHDRTKTANQYINIYKQVQIK